MSIIGIIQARMGSSRLPGKILYPLAGTSLLSVLTQRIRDSCATVDEWWLATSDQGADDITAIWGEKLGLRVYRGSETDVLSRFVSIQVKTKADWIVRVTADDPFMHGGLVDRLLQSAIRQQTQYVGPNLSHFPYGCVPEVISSDALLQCAENTTSDLDREHVTKWFRENQKTAVLEGGGLPCRPEWRWTVDTPEDYVAAFEVFELMNDCWRTVDYNGLVALFDDNPALQRRIK